LLVLRERIEDTYREDYMDTLERTPHNPEAEESILGAMLLSAEALEVAAYILTPEDFYNDQHGTIYKALLALRSQDKTPDPLVLADYLKERGTLEAVGDRAYIYLLQGTCPNPDNARHYARQVKDKANRRRVIDKAQRIENAAYIDQAPEELLAEVQRLAFDIEAERHIGGALESERDNLGAFMQALKDRQAERDFNGLDSGYAHFNRVCNGLGQGLFVIAGAPSCGKTTFVKQLLDQVAALNNVPCLFFSLEQSAEELRIKTLSRLSGIENRNIMRGRLATDSAGWEKVKGAAEKLGEYAERVYLVEADRHTTVDAIRLTASRAMRKAGADRCFIAIDYLQKMPASEKFEGAKERMDFLTSELRRLSRDLDSPVLVISSENRMGYKKKGLDVFKESGEIEYSADIAGVLLEEERQGDMRLVNLHIVKNRNGERATIQFDFDPQVSRFNEVGKTDYREPEE
jgi:replicative DNA helicase